MRKLGAKFFRLLRLKREHPQGEWRFVGDTHPGKTRKNNEDLWVVFRPKVLPDGRVSYATFVADGMGGPEEGEVAAALARDTVEKLWNELEISALSPNWPLDWGIAALRAANEAIIDHKDAGKGKVSSGTTGILVVYIGETVDIFHVGDSPAIQVDSRSIRQITVDHTEVGLATAEGAIDADPMAHVLVYALGHCTFWFERYDHNQVIVRVGQLILTATDGLIDSVGMPALAAILTRRGFLTKASDLFDKTIVSLGSPRLAKFLGCRELLDKIREELMAAYLAGKAEDNGTFVLARYTRQD